MATSAFAITTLTSTFTSLSFSSTLSSKPNSLPISRPIPLSSSLKPLTVSASASASASASVAASASASASVAASPVEAASVEAADLTKFVKSRLPGGFAAQTIIGTGRRKTASARVVLQEGTGKVIINYRDASDYLQGNPLWLQYVKTPLVILGYETEYDIFVKAQGGGLSGQAQAICLGVARALLKVSENHRALLKQEGLLTRDSRIVERKKVGLKKARKAPQYSKR